MSEGHTERLEAALAGRYRIERKLGEGGMASVYLAEDIKHKRKVALKILRPELAAVLGAERFLVEIQTTANLQHPHILALFDSGEAEGYLYYVMPFIDGETLREKLDREKQLGVEEAVRIARDVADALDYAHRNDVIHRDIKPGNILLHDGRPVVADFGIALAVSAAGGGRMTETGLSLGTPHYMSPEQASADRDLTLRSDVYSLGCVLYEMIAGQPPHTGPSAQSILVRIMTKEATPLAELRHTVPPHVAATVAKSIEKLPADRFETAKQFMEALGDERFTYQAKPRAPSEPQQPVLAAPTLVTRPWHRDPRTIAAGVAIALGAWGWLRPTPSPEGATTPVRSALTEFGFDDAALGMRFAISPDGTLIATRSESDSDLLFVRRVDQLDFREIPGTNGARSPTFSPAGQWLAFQQDEEIRRVEVAGRPVLPVAEGEQPHWGASGAIVFANGEQLYLVTPSGGDPVPLLSSEAIADPNGPFLLPGGDAVVFDAPGASPGDRRLMLVEVRSGEVTDLGIVGSHPTYASTGHLLFGHAEQALRAVPFDLDRLEVTGEAFTVLPDVDVNPLGVTRFAVSDNGTALYALSGSAAGASARVVEVSLDGVESPTRLAPGDYLHPRYSPDGRYIAHERDREVWVYDRDTGETERFGNGFSGFPVWSHDGRYLYYREIGQQGVRKLVDGTGEVEQVYQREGVVYPSSAAPEGDVFLMGEFVDPGLGMNLLVMTVEDDGAVFRDYLRAEYHEANGAISPDGRWVAYMSYETGEPVVFARSFADATGQVRISPGPGADPLWAPDGTAIYYRGGPRGLGIARMMKVPVTLGTELVPGEPEVLFEGGAYPRSNAALPAANWDIHPDGLQFVMITGESGASEASAGLEMRLVVNWFEELKALEGN